MAKLNAAQQRWVPILDPPIHVQPGYAAYDSGIAADVFLKDITGRPFVGQVRRRGLLLCLLSRIVAHPFFYLTVCGMCNWVLVPLSCHKADCLVVVLCMSGSELCWCMHADVAGCDILAGLHAQPDGHLVAKPGQRECHTNPFLTAR